MIPINSIVIIVYAPHSNVYEGFYKLQNVIDSVHNVNALLNDQLSVSVIISSYPVFLLSVLMYSLDDSI